jgi:PhoPQ-activated pathogenicity-related protein
VPNAKHNLGGSDAVESMTSFYQAIVAGKPRPRFSWTKEADGSLVVTVVDKPTEVRLWQATNPAARDFRVDTIGNAYQPTVLQETKKGVYVGKVAKPEHGYTAFFVELTYAGPAKFPFKFTTQVSVLPDVLPFKWEDALKKYANSATDLGR